VAPKKKPATPVMLGSLPIDQALALECLFYRVAKPDTTPPPEFMRRLMRQYEEEHPWRELTPQEIAARVDHMAARMPSLAQAKKLVAKILVGTHFGPPPDAVEEEHRAYEEWKRKELARAVNRVEYAHGRYGSSGAELSRQREVNRLIWVTEGGDMAEYMLLKTARPRPGPKKKRG
jgi:hypothetical protein